MKNLIRKFGFENYIILMGMLLLLIIIFYMWYEITKFYTITGEKGGFILVGFISFILSVLILMWIKDVINQFKNK